MRNQYSAMATRYQQVRINYLVFEIHKLITDGEGMCAQEMVEHNRETHTLSGWGFVDLRDPTKAIEHLGEVVGRFIEGVPQ